MKKILNQQEIQKYFSLRKDGFDLKKDFFFNYKKNGLYKTILRELLWFINGSTDNESITMIKMSMGSKWFKRILKTRRFKIMKKMI